MSTYVIGDIQGCFKTLKQLLERISYRPKRDRLWITGDLVNRGPGSLKTLRYLYERRDQLQVVLGNHDLHALSCAAGYRRPKGRDTLQSILQAPDRDKLLTWLSAQPLMFESDAFVMVHAGIAPAWSVAEARIRAREVEAHLQGQTQDALLAALQKKETSEQTSALGGAAAQARLLESVAVLTRMRTVDEKGRPTYGFAGPPKEAPPGQVPWYSKPHPDWSSRTLIFGHWAALGRRIMPGFWALDSGCVWGNTLTALRLEDRVVFEAKYVG